MLGYDKAESLFLPHNHIRDIFTLSGIVRPAILINGTVAGYWNKKNRKLQVILFEQKNVHKIEEAANKLWSDLKTITFK